MNLPHVSSALRRARTVLQRRPDIGLHDDAPASVRFTGGMRMVIGHPDGRELPTDMPTELGGTGDQITPGWLFRAGLASCSATCIAIVAAAEGVELSLLEVKASSRTDTRALLDVADADGRDVSPGPQDLRLEVRIAAPGVDAGRLRAVAESGLRRSPVPSALREGALAIDIDVVAAH